MFQILITMDGNDSLKQILCQDPPAAPAEGEPEPEGPQVGESREQPDLRKVGRDYLLLWENVDRWAKAILEELLPELEVRLSLHILNIY